MAARSDLDATQLYELAAWPAISFYVTEMLEAGNYTESRCRRVTRSSRAPDASPATRPGRYSETAALMGLRGSTPACSPIGKLRWTSSVRQDCWSARESGLRFRHEIGRLAIVQEIPAHRQAVIHAEILAALDVSGSRDDARMAFHAEGAGDEEAVVRHASLAARRAVDLGSHREAAAQYERALRWAAHAAPSALAELYTGLAEEATLSDRSQTAADADEQALRLWRMLDDRRHEGESLQHYSLTLKHLCHGDEGGRRGRRSDQDARAARRDARAGQGVRDASRFKDDGGNENDEAIGLARRAQDLARSLGASDVIADALNTEGCAASATDPGWIELIRRSLELAISRNLPNQAGRAYGNLYGISCDHFRFDEAEQYYRDGIAYCEQKRPGHDTPTSCAQLSSRPCSSIVGAGTKRWRSVLSCSRKARLGYLLNQICAQTLIGVTRARRGEPEAWRVLDRAIANAAPTGQPQYLIPTRLARAEAFVTEGRVERGATRSRAGRRCRARPRRVDAPARCAAGWTVPAPTERSMGPLPSHTGSWNPASTLRLRVRGMRSAGRAGRGARTA